MTLMFIYNFLYFIFSFFCFIIIWLVSYFYSCIFLSTFIYPMILISFKLLFSFVGSNFVNDHGHAFSDYYPPTNKAKQATFCLNENRIYVNYCVSSEERTTISIISKCHPLITEKKVRQCVCLQI